MSKSINTLTRQLRDLNADTRSKAVMNLGEMGADESVPSIISAFKKEQDENVRSIFAEAFALFGHFDSVIKTLITSKNDDESEKVKISAEWSLGQIAKKRGHASTQELLDAFNTEK